MQRYRKNRQDRIAEIKQAACDVFLTYGLQQATMEAIIAKTSLSKGGVYHYYTHIYDILYDLMIDGNESRIEIMKSFLKKHPLPDDSSERITFMTKLLLDKVMTDDPLSKIYVMFVLGAQTDPELLTRYERLVAECLIDLKDFFRTQCHATKQYLSCLHGMTHLINMFICSNHFLGAKSYWQAHQETLFAMLHTYLLSETARSTPAP